jgi:hypothetical protein
MGQAVADLPDPLDSPQPADGLSADDLLSKLAGDEIDRMLAEDGGDGAAMPAPPGAVAAAAVEPLVTTAVPTIAVQPAAAAVDLDDVLNTADAERTALHQQAIAVDASPTQIDLGDSAETRRRLPLILRPLVWINAPLDPWPERLRDVIGKIGVMTLINALAVIAYVLLFRHHH